MPPRIPLQPAARHLRVRIYNHAARLQQFQASSYATVATTPAPPMEQLTHAVSPVTRYPAMQPPSYKSPEVRKSQLHRQYQSMLRSAPLLLLFQHNNLRAIEWAGIRRELDKALRKVDAELGQDLAAGIRVQIVQTGILRSALRVIEFYRPELQPEAPSQHPTDPRSNTSARVPDTTPSAADPRLTHGLSRAAHDAAADRSKKTDLEVLLSGPVAAVTFPAVSPQYLKAVLQILAPSPDFPAPRRKANPEYHEPAVQSGLQKLILLGARVDGKVFDQEGTRWVGGIEGGLDGLRAQLVAMLQGFGAGLTTVLEGAGRSLYFTMESRKIQMEEEGKPKKEEEEAK